MYVRACMCICEGVYVYVYMCACVRACMCVYMRACVWRGRGGESLWGIVGYV